MLDRQTQQLRIISGENITEITGRHHELDLIANVDDLLFEQLRVSREIVDDLRYQTPNINRICRRQYHMRVGRQAAGKLAVAENALDSGLCVIEIALDCAHAHIRTGLRAHLQFLHLADLAFRIEHGDARALGIRKTSERCLAGISGSGGHDHDFLVVVAAGRGGARHETRQDLQCDVLECGGRAVE